jgi:4-alpha-glucanotransferase
MPRSSQPSDRARGELAARARAWGVETSWVDVSGARHRVPAATLEAILGVLGGLDRAAPPADAAEAPPAGEPLRCFLPPGLRTWGFAAQLYSVRSARSWGIGDYGDLGDLARWSAGLGAGVLLLNPLHFSTPVAPVPPSPYSPSSRRFRDPLGLRVEDVPGAAAALGPDLDAAQRAAADLRAAPLIDRDAVFTLKTEALRRIWAHTEAADAAELDAWRAGMGDDVDRFGVWCAIAEEHGASWPDWPEELRRRDSAAVARAAERLRDRARFHVWLQWQVDRQLAAVGRQVTLIHDLAIGVDPGGADAWLWPDVVAGGVHVGAPPDLFNTQGQDWGIAPFDPWRLRAAAYKPFAETVRACMRGAGGLRIDHVMGLSRLYWIPPGASPRDGAYVRYPSRGLFDVLARESVRAGAFVVGEDLGTVEPAMREQMAARDVLSYRLLWFEGAPPREWPSRALAAVTTHDLPTVAGVWTGADLRDQQRAGTAPDAERNAELRSRLARVAGLAEDAGVETAVIGAYRALAAAPSAVLIATLEDALAVEARPNMPGTTPAQWPSWSRPLPRTLEELGELPLPRRIADALDRR